MAPVLGRVRGDFGNLWGVIRRVLQWEAADCVITGALVMEFFRGMPSYSGFRVAAKIGR